MEKINIIEKVIQASKINLDENLEQPPVAIMINSEHEQVPALSLGNFSMVIGKAKSKKTFFIGALTAAAISGKLILNRILGTLPSNKKNVLYFDTEQGKFHVVKSVRRILTLSGYDFKGNLTAFSLRRYSPEIRLDVIERVINECDDIGIVIIDGGRDLLSLGINDEKQATDLTNRFLRWTDENQIHIIVALHQNKNDTNARGHFGTECINKAEMTISLTEAPSNKDISIVRCELSRGISFDNFAFRINIDGIPEFCRLPSFSISRRIQTLPELIDINQHEEFLMKVFEVDSYLSYSNLANTLKKVVTEEYANIGMNRAKEFIQFYLGKGMIIKDALGYKRMV